MPVFWCPTVFALAVWELGELGVFVAVRPLLADGVVWLLAVWAVDLVGAFVFVGEAPRLALFVVWVTCLELFNRRASTRPLLLVDALACSAVAVEPDAGAGALWDFGLLCAGRAEGPAVADGFTLLLVARLVGSFAPRLLWHIFAGFELVEVWAALEGDLANRAGDRTGKREGWREGEGGRGGGRKRRRNAVLFSMKKNDFELERWGKREEKRLECGRQLPPLASLEQVGWKTPDTPAD